MKQKKIPMRKCVGCNKMLPKQELLRIVCPKEGEVTPDESGRLGGRGAYICRSLDCLQKARKAHRLEREFSRQIPQSVYDGIERMLTEDDNDGG